MIFAPLSRAIRGAMQMLHYATLHSAILITSSDLEMISERGVEYEFRISAKNSVDFGDVALETITTPDGSELH